MKNNTNWRDYKNYSLYLVTDGSSLDVLIKKVEAAVKGGVIVVQLREKLDPIHGVTLNSIIEKAKALHKLTQRYNIPLIINDHLEAAQYGDGFHFGQGDHEGRTVAEIRQLIGKDKIIGKSTHSVEQALQAAEEGVDYMGAGPVFQTPTKKDTIPIGLDVLKKIVKSVNKPVVAIGGIKLWNIDQVLKCNPAGVALITEIMNSDDPELMSTKLKEKL